MSWKYEPIWGAMVCTEMPRIYHVTGSRVFPNRLPVRIAFRRDQSGSAITIDGTRNQGHMIMNISRVEISESNPNRIRLEGEKYGLMSCLELRFSSEKSARETYSLLRYIFAVNGSTFH